jgi:hypothetical protein
MWTTDDEIRFVRRIGKWCPNRHMKKTKLELLQNYLNLTIKRNTFGPYVDKEYLIGYLEGEIENEKLGLGI